MRFAMGIRCSRGVAALLVASLATAGCSDTGVGPGASPPQITSATVSIAGGPIFRSMEVSLDTSAHVRVDYWSERTPRLRIQSAVAATHHDLFLGRLQAGNTYEYEVRSETSDGELGLPYRGSFATGILPPGLREIEIATIGSPTYPLTMIEAVAPSRPFYPFIVDERGYIVWYREAESGSGGFTRLENGNFVFNTMGGLWVVTPRNEVVGRLEKPEAAVRTGIDPFTIHHDVIRTPENTVLMLVHDTTLVNDTVWTGEAVWEWDPATDRLEKRWASKDFFDPRVDRGSRTTAGDWLHANSLGIGPRGNILVSLFWLHEVFSIAPDYGSIEWRLGGPQSSFQVEDDAMEAGQHTATELGPDRILMFDNGRERSRGLYSRALEMEIDRESGTATVAWEFRPQPDIYAPVISSARRLENGNTVVGFGMAEGSLEGASGPLAVFEVTPEGHVPWRLEVVEGLRFMYRATPLFTVAGERVVPEP